MPTKPPGRRRRKIASNCVHLATGSITGQLGAVGRVCGGGGGLGGGGGGGGWGGWGVGGGGERHPAIGQQSGRERRGENRDEMRTGGSSVFIIIKCS